MQDNPDEGCAKGGHGAYGQAVNYVVDPKSNLTKVGDSYFMSYHTILKSSADYYNAMKEARTVASNITNMINTAIRDLNSTGSIEVFPYSIFYVFYEQYLTMWSDTLFSLGVSLIAIFMVTFILMGFDIFLSIVIIVTIFMIVVNLGGLMYWWNISLNAVSLVNLVMVIIKIIIFILYIFELLFTILFNCRLSELR